MIYSAWPVRYAAYTAYYYIIRMYIDTGQYAFGCEHIPNVQGISRIYIL